MDIQGDPAPCSKPPVDIDVKVAFYDKVLILKRNFKSMSTGGSEKGAGSPCSCRIIKLFDNDYENSLPHYPIITAVQIT